LRWSRRLYRFGRSFINLELTDAAVDGPLKGTLHIPRRLPPGTVVQLELTCTRTTSDGDANDNFNIRHVVEYDKVQDINPSSSFDSIEAIPFEFQIPASATPTTPTHKLGFSRISNAWALTAASTTPGVDFWAKFVIPIAEKSRIEKGDIHRYFDQT
jgi:hypothetical protein